MSVDDRSDVSRDTVSLSYQELAARLGIDVQSARRRALRSRWAKTKGNDGKARVAVPRDVLPAVKVAVTATDGRTGQEQPLAVAAAAGTTGPLPSPPVVPAAGTTESPPPPPVAVTSEALSHLLSQVAELAEVRERLGRAEGEAMQLRDSLEREIGRADREAARADREAAARQAIEVELGAWLAGGPFARALRAFLNQRSGR